MSWLSISFLSRAEQSRAEQSRAEQSRAEQSRAERIEWIDIAKGIAILLVIIGHTVKYGSLTRNIIFSFHMPLFFILSGYTFKPAVDLKNIVMHLKKNIKHLLIPCLAISMLQMLYSIIQDGDYSLINFLIHTYKMLRTLFYASGVEYKHTVAGMIWFIFSLFWAKTLLDVIYIFQKKNAYCIVGCLGFLGLCLGSSHNWIPQNFDVTLVACLFIYMGVLWKSNNRLIEKYTKEIFIISLIIWSFLISLGIYIEMASRSYPYYPISVIEAICASFVFCMCCKACLDYNYIKNILTLLGMDSLILFYIHHCDWMLREIWILDGKMLQSIIVRLFTVLIIYLVILSIRKITNKKF